MERITAVKGMNDLLPVDRVRWHRIEDRARATFERYGFGEVRTPILFLVTLGDEARKRALVIASDLRGRGLLVDQDLRGGGLKAQMRRADKSQARFALVLGEAELQSGRARLKRMQAGEEREVSLSALYEELAAVAPA